MAVRIEEDVFFYGVIENSLRSSIPYSIICAIGTPDNSMSTGYQLNAQTILKVDGITTPITAVREIVKGTKVEFSSHDGIATEIRVIRS